MTKEEIKRELDYILGLLQDSQASLKDAKFQLDKAYHKLDNLELDKDEE